VRTTMQATAAILGGTQSLHTNSKDEALSLPTEKSARTALRTQQILAYETGIPDVIDPLAGSYYVESLTDSIEEEVFKLIDQIDNLGGSIKAIEQGFQQNEISNTSFKYQKAIDNQEQIIVGVNKYENQDNIEKPELQQIDQDAIEEQLSRLKLFKTNRNNNNVQLALADFRKSLTKDINLLPIIIHCIKNNCTLGEICQIMRDVHGEHI